MRELAMWRMLDTSCNMKGTPHAVRIHMEFLMVYATSSEQKGAKNNLQRQTPAPKQQQEPHTSDMPRATCFQGNSMHSSRTAKLQVSHTVSRISLAYHQKYLVVQDIRPLQDPFASTPPDPSGVFLPRRKFQYLKGHTKQVQARPSGCFFPEVWLAHALFTVWSRL